MVKDATLKSQIDATSREVLGVLEEIRLLEPEKVSLREGDPRAVRLSREIRKLAGEVQTAAGVEEGLAEEASSEPM
jgi:hypothetical protein